LPSGGLDPASKAEALKAIDALKEQIESGEIDCLAYSATGGEYVYHGHYGCHNDPYRIVGSLQALAQYLLYIYHVDELTEE